MVVVWSWITLSVDTEIAINRKAISHWETVINNETRWCKENTIFNEDSSSSFSSYPDIINPRDHRPRHSHNIWLIMGHHCPPVKVHHNTHKSHLLVNCGGEELPWRRIWLPPLGNLPQKNRGGRDHPHHHHHQGHHHRHQCDHPRHHNRRRHHNCHHTVFVAVIVIVIIIITIINKIIWLPPNKKLPQKRWRTLCVVDGYSSSSPQLSSFKIFCHICCKHKPCLTWVRSNWKDSYQSNR